MANPTDALLTDEDRAFVRRMKSRLQSDAICVAQHRATLRWVADWIASKRPETYDDFGAGREYENKELADELRALADGRGEG